MTPENDQGSGGFGAAPKRPAPTIEGTATEIRVEPAREERTGEAQHRQHRRPEAEEPRHEARNFAPPPNPQGRTSPSELKGFVTHLAAGLLGGLLGVIGLALVWDRLPVQGGPAPATDLSALERRIADLESQVGSIQQAVSPEQLAAVEARLRAMEGAPAADTKDLEARLARLEESFATLTESAKAGPSVSDAAAIAAQISDAERRLEAKLDARLQNLPAEVQDESAKADLALLKDRIVKLEEALPALSGTVDKQASQAGRAALALAFTNFRAAVDSGRAYAAELATVQSLSPQPLDLGELATHASTGIPTLAALSQSFDARSDAALAAEPPPTDASIMDRLLASARSVVKVRRVGEIPGTEPDAVLARARVHLNQGALGETVKEIASLPNAQAQAFADWLATAKARLAADEALARLESELLVSLSGESSRSGEQR